MEVEVKKKNSQNSQQNCKDRTGRLAHHSFFLVKAKSSGKLSFHFLSGFDLFIN